jgi:hypothetical protein
MAKAEAIKTNFLKGPVADAIGKDVAAQIAHANSVLATWRGYVDLCSKGHMQPSDARALLQNINLRLAAARKENHDPRKIAPLQDSRVSEAASILRMSEWKCWPAIFDMLKGMDVASGGRGVNAGTLLAVSKYLRIEAKWNKDTATPPARDKVLRAIDKRRTQRRTSEKPSNTATVRNPINTLDVIKRNARGLAKWFGKDKAEAARFIDTIMKAAANVESVAKKVVKEREAAAAAA